jgi:hypothetical protein
LPRSHALISATDAADLADGYHQVIPATGASACSRTSVSPFTNQYSDPIPEPAADTSPGMASRVHNTAKMHFTAGDLDAEAAQINPSVSVESARASAHCAHSWLSTAREF